MSDTVKVIWDEPHALTICYAPRESVTFIPGITEVPIDIWKQMTKGKRENPGDNPELFADDPGGLNYHLKGGKLRLADKSVQQADDLTDIAKMNVEAAVEVIGETFDENVLAAMRQSEESKPGRARKKVMDAIDAQQENFDKLKAASDSGVGKVGDEV